MRDLFGKSVPLFFVFVLIFIGIMSGFGIYPICNRNNLPKPDTIYIDVNKVIYDTIFITKTVVQEKTPLIDTLNKKDFIMSNSFVVEENGFINIKTIIKDIPPTTYQDLYNRADNIKNILEYRLPTVERIKYVPISTSKEQACLNQIKGSLITIGVESAIIIGSYILYRILK